MRNSERRRMILYHFAKSPFCRRIRLVCAHKSLSLELRDARANTTHLSAVHRLNPLHTVPILVDEDHVIIDSAAISQYLDRKNPEPPLWPLGLASADAFHLSALADGVINLLNDLGMRYFSLHDHVNFPIVSSMILSRVRRALDQLATDVSGHTLGPLCGEMWSEADMALYTMVEWLEGMPLRAATFPPIRNVVSLGWSLPEALSRWADQHRQRGDVLALG
jgi:glutathione S-transferase